MAPNDSHHLLPMNSIIFSSTPNLRKRLPTSPTLVDLSEAADTTVTALPPASIPVAKQTRLKRRSKMKRLRKVARKIARVVFGKPVDPKYPVHNNTNEGRVKIGVPTNVQHVETGGPRKLSTPKKSEYRELRGEARESEDE
ncbi:hypothetical protein EK21DRAFT_107076 [Setomelanomma holmii]|uniref:Uncharacterized protein n=1 Tax=Setomelanomma holmii TaxID=210430 RepID=A0A9P4HL66_9PLEO|nr:hypothetical protein EK21DRAFT_107076 [Setomelanomma holmii]